MRGVAVAPNDSSRCTSEQAPRRRVEGVEPKPPSRTPRNQLQRSDADSLGEELAVVGRVAEEQLGALGPLEVEVGRVLPGEADAAVDLDVLGGAVEVGLRA